MITHTRNIICTLLLSAMPLVAAMAQKNVKNMKNVKKTVPMACIKHPMQKDGIVRLSKIEVLPEHLDEYVVFASEVGEVSLRTEPGVLTMYAVADKENPCKITILETYASKQATKITYLRNISANTNRALCIWLNRLSFATKRL